MLLTALPTELLCSIFSYLDFRDLETLIGIGPIKTITHDYLIEHSLFEYPATLLLLDFEALPANERCLQSTLEMTANAFFELLCSAVDPITNRFERGMKFGEYLGTLEQWVARRILSVESVETDYAALCLCIRHVYLERPALRMLHDPKYRRRSTKFPFAPFLPREYAYIWRQHCAEAVEMKYPWYRWRCSATTGDYHQDSPLAPLLSPQHRFITAHLCRRRRFARFFGSLFQVTSVYLESHLSGTFDEATREALVSGDVESMLIMCEAAGKASMDPEELMMIVALAEERLLSYIDLMGDLMSADPTPEQAARMNLASSGADGDTSHQQPPEWLMPSRYRIDTSNQLRLKVSVSGQSRS
ncbi:hypothetical protein BX666DRAFT_1589921 [Dichotomocladium elegans]|nr:hypothetical protein BX666DRAFT_1589921 [Dichotomocladium elegans]